MHTGFKVGSLANLNMFFPFLVWLSPYVAVFYEINSSDLPIIIAKHDLLEDI